MLSKGDLYEGQQGIINFWQSLNDFLSRYLPFELKFHLATRKTNFYSGKKTIT